VAATAKNEKRRGASASPSSFSQGDEVTHLVIGRVVSVRGLGGELKVQIETEDPNRFMDLETVYLGKRLDRFSVRQARLFKGQALLKLAGIEDRTAAEAWVGSYVQVHIDDALPLDEGQFYVHQLYGLRVETEDGEALGEIDDIIVTGANDVYVVKGNGPEVLIPAIPEVILDIDQDAERVTVRLLPGLR